jgi:AcrR family transcriptional regulator
MSARRNRKDQLLDAALEAFGRQGYEGTGIAELAAMTEMSKAAVGYHFPSKEHLLRELVQPLLDSLEGVTAGTTGHVDWPEGARRLLGGYLRALTDHRAVAVWVDGDKSVLNHPEVGQRLDHVNDAVVEAITGPHPGELERLLVTAALGSLWRPVRSLPELDLRARQDDLLEAAMAVVARLPDGAH